MEDNNVKIATEQISIIKEAYKSLYLKTKKINLPKHEKTQMLNELMEMQISAAFKNLDDQDNVKYHDDLNEFREKIMCSLEVWRKEADYDYSKMNNVIFRSFVKMFNKMLGKK